MTPVRDDAGEVVALVSVGLSVDEVGEQLRGRGRRSSPARRCSSLLVAGVGSVLLSRRVRRLTYGLGAEELARMYACYDAVLHSVPRGPGRRSTRPGGCQLANDEARRLLDLPADLAGPPGATTSACRASSSRCSRATPSSPTPCTWPGDRVVVVSGAPAEVDGQVLGRGGHAAGPDRPARPDR